MSTSVMQKPIKRVVLTTTTSSSEKWDGYYYGNVDLPSYVKQVISISVGHAFENRIAHLILTNSERTVRAYSTDPSTLVDMIVAYI